MCVRGGGVIFGHICNVPFSRNRPLVKLNPGSLLIRKSREVSNYDPDHVPSFFSISPFFFISDISL